MLSKEDIQAHCMSKKGAAETYPFDEFTLVYKVMGKMFALIPMNTDKTEPPRMNLKCDPIHAEILRETYESVIPGYHMNKKHWNTVICDDEISQDEIYEMIDNSYDLVVKSLKKADKIKLMEIDN